jgi:hypothetical protein
MTKLLFAMTALIPVSAFAQSATTTEPCQAAPTTSHSGYFTVSGNQLIDPATNTPLQLRGINIYAEQLANAVQQPDGSPLTTTLFPGINFLRVNVFNADASTAAMLQPYIATLSKLGVMMEIEDHNYPGVLSGSDLDAAVQFYQTMAAATVGNQWVIYGTQNEPDPGTGDVNTELTAIYNAVRGSGNMTPIILMVDSNDGVNQSTAAKMKNAIFDRHFYTNNQPAWSNPGQALQDEIAQMNGYSDADGNQIGSLVLEYGCCSGSYGTNPDPNWQAGVNAVQSSGLGTAAWAYTSGDPSFPLLINDGNGNAASGLTSFGQMIAQFMSAGSGPGNGSYTGTDYTQQLCVLSQGAFPNANPAAAVASAQQQAQQAQQSAQPQASTSAAPAQQPGQAPDSAATPSAIRAEQASVQQPINQLSASNPATPAAPIAPATEPGQSTAGPINGNTAQELHTVETTLSDLAKQYPSIAPFASDLDQLLTSLVQAAPQQQPAGTAGATP